MHAACGSRPARPRCRVLSDLGELTDDALAGPYRVLQRRRGHRYSFDDVVTAWEAARARPEARSYADLGCGLGSVLLMVAYKLPREARLAAVEAQEQSARLARENVARNGLAERVRLVHGDLRAPDLLASLGGERFELVTGTPPYLPPSSGSPSTDAQRTYARLEMRGGVEEYVRAAAGVLAPGGRFVVCCDARRPERVREAAREAELALERCREVMPRAGHKGPLFTVWTLSRERAEPIVEPPLVLRDEGGARTAEAHALRRFFDLPVNEAEPPSPGARA
ncbi:MAG: methyltransferase [Sandaracinaceae bacterium]|nr:methyltransferase [Sandaracinaceae bacterium]